MQGRAPGRRTKVSKGPGAVVRSLSGARTVREGSRNGSDRTRRRPTKEGRDRARRRARRGTARSESRGPREETEADDRVLTLLVGVLHAGRKEAFNLRRLPEISPVVGRDGLNRILGGNIAVEVEDLCLELHDADGSDWKPLWRDGRVDPVVAAVSHHVLKRLAVVDGNDAGTDRISVHRSAPVALVPGII